VHVVNEHRFDYRAGDVFLLGPEDHHLFRISTPTEFCYIRFTDLFFRATSPGNATKTGNKPWSICATPPTRLVEAS
jgi:hypothetical protein